MPFPVAAAELRAWRASFLARVASRNRRNEPAAARAGAFRPSTHGTRSQSTQRESVDAGRAGGGAMSREERSNEAPKGRTYNIASLGPARGRGNFRIRSLLSYIAIRRTLVH